LSIPVISQTDSKKFWTNNSKGLIIPAMNLKTYLEEEKARTQDRKFRQKFCDKLEIHYQHLNNILRGERHPSKKLAALIEQHTNGAVTRMEALFPNGE